jgi:hypothetical protein
MMAVTDLTINLDVKLTKMFRLRLWLGTHLLALAYRAFGRNIDMHVDLKPRIRAYGASRSSLSVRVG